MCQQSLNSIFTVVLSCGIKIVNFVELMELNRAFSSLPFKCKDHASFQFYDAQKDGYCIFVKKEDLDDSCLLELRKIVEKRNLDLRESGTYFIIASRYALLS